MGSDAMGSLAPCVNMKMLAGVTARTSKNSAAAESDSNPALVKAVRFEFPAKEEIPAVKSPKPPANSATPVQATWNALDPGIYQTPQEPLVGTMFLYSSLRVKCVIPASEKINPKLIGHVLRKNSYCDGNVSSRYTANCPSPVVNKNVPSPRDRKIALTVKACVRLSLVFTPEIDGKLHPSSPMPATTPVFDPAKSCVCDNFAGLTTFRFRISRPLTDDMAPRPEVAKPSTGASDEMAAIVAIDKTVIFLLKMGFIVCLLSFCIGNAYRKRNRL
mmetsp:Transcript_34624/g.81633  ORF Transcript_34624/g.81633 Transcript_34624/m.81633 type:complete len:274 (-) Transcript_34624:91-912(-)